MKCDMVVLNIDLDQYPACAAICIHTEYYIIDKGNRFILYPWSNTVEPLYTDWESVKQ